MYNAFIEKKLNQEMNISSDETYGPYPGGAGCHCMPGGGGGIPAGMPVGGSALLPGEP